ncbi:serine hydrolase domain-containing protein [Pseudonocardia sulfidoxydans]
MPDVLAHQVFRPLGMRDTAFHVAGPDAGRLAACYGDDPAGGPARVDDGGQWARPPAFPAGSCGLLSTAGDYARFATALAGGDLLAPTTVARMAADRLTGPQHGSMLLGDRGWGLGVAVDPAGRYGWDGGFGTSWFTDPATGGVAVLMTQRQFCAPLMQLMGDFRDGAGSLFEQ